MALESILAELIGLALLGGLASAVQVGLEALRSGDVEAADAGADAEPEGDNDNTVEEEMEEKTEPKEGPAALARMSTAQFREGRAKAKLKVAAQPEPELEPQQLPDVVPEEAEENMEHESDDGAKTADAEVEEPAGETDDGRKKVEAGD